MKQTNDYNVDMQRVFLRMMMTNAELFTRVTNIFNPENFDRTLRECAQFIKEHTEQYKTMPDSTQVSAQCGVTLDVIQELNEGHYDWFLTEFEGFTRRKELERAILQSADLLEKGNYDPVEKLIKDAVQISLTKDMGTDYFADPRARLEAIKSNNGQVSTGWPTLDSKLYGGFNRGELQIFAGGSGSGKSLFMQNLSVNWATAGLNGVYISLELSEGLCAWRIDSMMTDIETKRVFKSIDDVEMKVKMIAKKAGNFRIKYLPAQSTINDIRAYCKELEIQSKMKLDFLCIDYLDLLMPVSAKVSPSDLFVKDKYVSEEIRNLAKELNVLLVTASQLNRAAVEEVEFDHSHISGGISKINTADNVFGIFTSRSMRERGMYQIQLMKTRSSSGVGQKIDLQFDTNTLRITDEGTNEYANNNSQPSPSNILSQIKPQSSVIAGTTYNPVMASAMAEAVQEREVATPKAEVASARLKSMINNMRPNF